MNLENLVSLGEQMHQELGREYYETGAGLKSVPDFQAIYDRYRSLTGSEALELVLATGDPKLREWIVGLRVERKVAPIEERQFQWEQQASVEVDGQEIPYLRVPIELSNSPDRDRRMALDRARVGAIDELARIRAERFELEREEIAALDLGSDYVSSMEVLTGIPLDQLGSQASAFLKESEAAYDDSLRRLVKKRFGSVPGRLLRSDSAWVFRADDFDSAFDPGTMIDTALRQMKELGLDAACGGRVRFDTEERAGKQPRAFCVPVHVPDEVYLVLRPRGGHNDFHTFWHELGHSMHFASVDHSRPFADRWLGDNSVTEGFAMLYDHMTTTALWLQQYSGLNRRNSRELEFELAVSELYLVRRYAGKLVYELSFHRSDPRTQGDHYAEQLTGATLFEYDPADSLIDVDPGFYAARYLRAWQLESALSNHLVSNYDYNWFRNPHAGEFIRDLMARGQADPAEVLARTATGGELGFESVLQSIEQRLN